MLRYVTIFGQRVRFGSRVYRWLQAHKKAIHGWVKKHKPAPDPPIPPVPAPPAPVSMFMFDDVNVSLIPRTAKAVAGYVDGNFKTWLKVKELFPGAHKLSIAVRASDNADCLDVEKGDALPGEAAGWIKRQHLRGKKLPVVYTSASSLQSLVDELAKVGLVHCKDYLVWSAHYGSGKHFCSPKCGFGIKVTADATQFTDRAAGKSLDESIVAPHFFA